MNCESDQKRLGSLHKLATRVRRLRRFTNRLLQIFSVFKAKANMRVLYDGSVYAHQITGGISRYFANIIKNVPFPILTTRKNRTLNYPEHPALEVYKFPAFPPERISSALGKFYFRAVDRFSRPNVIHPMYYSRLTGKIMSRRRCPLVITVWDMIHEIFSDTMDPQGAGARERKRLYLDPMSCFVSPRAPRRIY